MMNHLEKNTVSRISIKESAMPKLTVTKGPLKGRSFTFVEEVVFVGRSEGNDFQLKDGLISRKHLKIYRRGQKTYVEDLNSKNGTFINGKTIVPGKGWDVSENDIIRIGNTEIRLTDLTSAKTSPAEKVGPEPFEAISRTKKRSIEKRQAVDRKNLDLIWGITELIRQSIDINEVLEKVLVYMLDSLPRVDTAVIALFDMGREEIWETISNSRNEQESKSVRYCQSIVERVLKEGKSIRMSNTNFESPENITDSIIALKIQSILCVPLISNSKMLGAIYLDSRDAYGFRKDDQLLINSLSGPVAVAVEKSILAATMG